MARTTCFRRAARFSSALHIAAVALALGVPLHARADPAIADPGYFLVPLDGSGDGADSRHLYVFGTPKPFSGPIVWRYNDAGRPASLSLDAVINGVNAATQKWTDVCKVDISRGADTTSLPQDMSGSNTSPGENVLGWGDLSTGPNGSPGIAGVTYSYTSSGTLVEMDMTFSVSNVTTTSNLAQVAVHEWGHALGLSHSNVPSTVMSGPGSPFNPGVPATAYTGLSALTDDDKHGCLCLYGPSTAMAGQGYLCGLPGVADMGTVPVGSDSPVNTFTVRNASSTSSLTINSVQFSSSEMRNDGGCASGTVLGAGQSCSLSLVFHPAGSTGTRPTSYLRIATSNGVGTYTVPVTATSTTTTVPPAPTLLPSTLDFGSAAVGATTGSRTSTLTNQASTALTLSAVTKGGAQAGEFAVSGGCSAGTTLPAGGSCTLQATFSPQAAGSRNAYVDVVAAGSTMRLTLHGIGTASGGGGTGGTVVEFYNASLDHYFMTADAGEVAVLDTGTIAGWTRTGVTFNTYLVATGATSPVCRYYIPPAQGDSHFFSVFPSECNVIPHMFPTFVFEGANVMYMFLPNVTTGACPSGSVPVYRVWNARADTNHRYMIDRALRDQMVARGYVPEGYGPDGVGMCAPQ